MKETKIVCSASPIEQFRGDLILYCVGQDKNKKPKMIKEICTDDLVQAIDYGDFQGKENEQLLTYCHKKKNSFGGRVLFLGIGRMSNKTGAEVAEILREAGGRAAKVARKIKAKNVCLCQQKEMGVSSPKNLECLLEGLLLGDYSFEKYKNKKDQEKKFCGIRQVSIRLDKEEKRFRLAVRRASNSARATCVARDMANEPGNGWTPNSFALYAKKLAKTHKLRCTVLGKSELKRMKMGGILAVNQGSSEAPKMVILEYRCNKQDAQTLLLVGKGLTFDSGGVSLKPGSGMQDMKYDMCGGAAALSAMAVVGEEAPEVNVIAIIPSTENMPGGSALKPGDIITHYNGITSEIINTDAEGRLILADALAYGIEKYSPDCVIDLATLTGAVIIGLGHHRTGLLSNNQSLVKSLYAAGEDCGEPLWQLPLDKEYIKQIDSDVADIKNTGGRPAGTITAAAYLQKFVGDTPWAHMDIAGTAWDFTEKKYIPKGPSGIGVRTLVSLIRNWKGEEFDPKIS